MIELVYKLNGEGLEHGLDVFELAPTLYSFGKLIQEAYNVTFPDEPEVQINIKPFEKGSFKIHFLFFIKDMLDGFVAQTNMESIQNQSREHFLSILNYLGILASISGVNVMSLIGLIKGVVKRIILLKSGNYQYITQDNKQIEVPREIHDLYQNKQIQQNLYIGIGRPLEQSGVVNIESYLVDQEETKNFIKKEVAEQIKNSAKMYSGSKESRVKIEDIGLIQIEQSMPDLLAESKQSIERNEIYMVHPIRGNFEGTSSYWSFKIAETGKVFNARIIDEVFLNGVKTGKYRLNH